MRYLSRAISEVLRAALATLAGMAVFFMAIVMAVFVIPALALITVALGALLLASCFALTFWMFTRDPNALRGFWMFSLMGAAPFGLVALLRHIVVEILRARTPRDAPFVELPEIAVERSMQQPIVQRGTPWMRNNRWGHG